MRRDGANLTESGAVSHAQFSARACSIVIEHGLFVVHGDRRARQRR
jgi:hypothetical protein